VQNRITDKKIEPLELLNKVREEAHGGNVLFVGTVRNKGGNKKLAFIEYEVYRELAERTLQAILLKVKRRYPNSRVEVIHRYGRLSPGEVSVVVAASSEHRVEAFKACMYTINLIKRQLPVWKKEKYLDGSENWVRGERI
jgi:molybdopterin synthase catalytic subunit